MSVSAVVFWEGQGSPEGMVTHHQVQAEFQSYDTILFVCATSDQQSWEENPSQLEIVYLLKKNLNAFEIKQVSVTKKRNLFLHRAGKPLSIPPHHFFLNDDSHFFKKLQALFNAQTEDKFQYSPTEPLFLEPVYIPKPWGQEIWFTGVEKRGVSFVRTEHSPVKMPIPHFFKTLPKSILGENYAEKNLVLIKILDPSPAEVKGDLYYELHQEKNEVYIVTDISAPEGKIKMGINPEKLKAYENRMPQLKKDFLKAIEEYEVVRREIDLLIDEQKDIPAQLESKEIQLRKNMDSFAGYLDLNVGDVVVVPTLLPHALQHGVRVVEFQTPTYERLIISFAQKVLTQKHWDTQKAFELMQLAPPQKTTLTLMEDGPGYQEELVCSFDDFYSFRVTCDDESKYKLKACAFYQVVFLVKGDALFVQENCQTQVRQGQCVLIPAFASLQIIAQMPCLFLVCSPEKI